MMLRSIRKDGAPDLGFGRRLSESQTDNVTKLPALGLRRAEPSHSQFDPEWAELLAHLRQSGASMRMAEDRATQIAKQAESVARQAVQELEESRQAVDVSRAAEKAAMQRADDAEDRAVQAELRARRAEMELAEKTGLLARLQDELWKFVLAADKAAQQERTTSAAA